MLEDLYQNLNDAMDRALGKRGTYVDAHVLAVAVVRYRRLFEVAAAAAVVGWTLLIVTLAI